jgi:uncharacterized protein
LIRCPTQENMRKTPNQPLPARRNQAKAFGRRVAARRAFVLLPLALFLPAVALQPPDAADLQSFEKWKAELVDDLKQRWLVLAGLFWLKPGATSFGAAQDNAIIIPSGPAHAGSFHLENRKVSVEFRSGVQAKIDGKIVSGANLESDEMGKPTMIEMGSLRIYVISRGQRLGVRVRDMDSPAVRKYAGPVFFPLDMDYRVTATFVPSDGKKTVEVPDVLGDITPTPSPGEVHFKLNGRELALTALSGDPAHGISFVISDLTSKTDTYPGGRFLDTDPVLNGRVVLDFNRAYSPPCAVTPYATCPLAPKENRLPVAIYAGEKYDRKRASH